MLLWQGTNLTRKQRQHGWTSIRAKNTILMFYQRVWGKSLLVDAFGVYLTCSPQSSPTEDGQKMHPLQNMEDGGRHY